MISCPAVLMREVCREPCVVLEVEATHVLGLFWVPPCVETAEPTFPSAHKRSLFFFVATRKTS